MKLVYLTASVIFTAIILIISFGNINAQCNDLFFFFSRVNATPTIIILAVAILGIITGALYHAFISRIMSSSDEESEDEDF